MTVTRGKTSSKIKKVLTVFPTQKVKASGPGARRSTTPLRRCLRPDRFPASAIREIKAAQAISRSRIAASDGAAGARNDRAREAGSDSTSMSQIVCVQVCACDRHHFASSPESLSVYRPIVFTYCYDITGPTASASPRSTARSRPGISIMASAGPSPPSSTASPRQAPPLREAKPSA